MHRIKSRFFCVRVSYPTLSLFLKVWSHLLKVWIAFVTSSWHLIKIKPYNLALNQGQVHFTLFYSVLTSPPSYAENWYDHDIEFRCFKVFIILIIYEAFIPKAAVQTNFPLFLCGGLCTILPMARKVIHTEWSMKQKVNSGANINSISMSSKKPVTHGYRLERIIKTRNCLQGKLTLSIKHC